MTVKELHDMNFNDAAAKLCDEHDFVTTYEILKEFAVSHINGDNLFLAIHILQALEDNPADFYAYDFCMGTLQTPTPLLTASDLEDYCEGGAFT